MLDGTDERFPWEHSAFDALRKEVDEVEDMYLGREPLARSGAGHFAETTGKFSTASILRPLTFCFKMGIDHGVLRHSSEQVL